MTSNNVTHKDLAVPVIGLFTDGVRLLETR